MSELPSVQPPQHFLELIVRPYKKRDEILESSNRLVDYSYKLQNCGESELETLQSEIHKEVNSIISNVNGLAPFLDNPDITGRIVRITSHLSLTLEHSRFESGVMLEATMRLAANLIRTGLCPLANMTRLKLTPKSFKDAYGIEIGIKDIVKIKGFYEHHQNNY
jgi:hypothetical protein